MRPIKKDSTNESVNILIIDSTTGIPETAVEHDTGGIDLWYRREGATKTSITEVALAALDTAHTDGGIEHIGNGVYRLDPPDAAFATGCNGVQFGGTVTGMIVIGCYVHLVDYDPQDTVRLGLTALPNAAADAAGGLVISDAGAQDFDAMNTAAVRLTAARAGVLDDWINDGRLDLLLDAIPTTAMRGTDNAALASVVGALNNVAAAGDPTDADTLMQYIKQLINVLIGTAGIGTFPAEAAPGNAVSLAEVVRAIHADVATTIPGTITTAQNDLDTITGASGVVIQDGTIVAASLGADCITAAKIADDAIVAANLATGAITADAFAADAIVAATLATGALTADAFAANALVAATFNADCITAAKVAADVHTEGATAVWDSTEAITGQTHSFETILTRIYRFMMNKMNITDATGAVALRNEADSADIMTQTITDNATTTLRTEAGW